MGAGSSKGGHHNDVFKHGQSKGGSEGQSQKQDQAVMSGKRSVGYFVSLQKGSSRFWLIHRQVNW
jgi:hypothetical protein